LNDIEIFLDETAIKKRVKELGRKIDLAYADLNPVVVIVLKGSFVFASDLVRTLGTPLEIEFIRCRSYGSETTSSGVVEITMDLNMSIKSRHVLLVEDIVDTGLTARYLINHLLLKNPLSLKVCSFLHKPAKTVEDVKIDFCGFEAPDRFLIGYGLDFDEKYRELPFIGFLPPDDGEQKES